MSANECKHRWDLAHHTKCIDCGAPTAEDMSTNKKALAAIVYEIHSGAVSYIEPVEYAARLLIEARLERNEAREEYRRFDTEYQKRCDERDAAKKEACGWKAECAEWKKTAKDVATERDAAFTAHQESLQTVAELRESLRVAEARAERFKAEMYRVDEVQTAKLLVATDRVAALEGELATWKEDHAEAMRLAWENGERRDVALARVRELESTPASRLWHDKFKARIAQLEARVQDLAPYEHEVGAVHRYNSELAERIAELEAEGAQNRRLREIVEGVAYGTDNYGGWGDSVEAKEFLKAAGLAEGSEGGE